MDTLEGQYAEAASLARATRSALHRDESSDEFIPGLTEATVLEWAMADAARTRLQVSVLMAATLSRAIEVYPPGSITGGGLDNAGEALALACDRAGRGDEDAAAALTLVTELVEPLHWAPAVHQLLTEFRDRGAPDTYAGAIALASEMRELAGWRLPKEPPNPLPLSEWMLLDGRLRGALRRAASVFDEPIAGELRGAADR